MLMQYVTTPDSCNIVMIKEGIHVYVSLKKWLVNEQLVDIFTV